MSLFEQLKFYSKEKYMPMHMPGHKRNMDLFEGVSPYAIDITEIDGFDDYHNPSGIFKSEEDELRKMYDTDFSRYLVNGSTVGILAAISASTKKGDNILVARNCHKSVYNGIFLNELKAQYIFPQQYEGSMICKAINPVKVEEAFKANPDFKAVVITSPTYEGIVSDISAISQIVHSYDAILIVDEAHGAHFGFHEDFCKSAIKCGADIVVQSWHKTLPAFTQSAIIHVKANNVLVDKVKMYLSIFQSSSPSYILLSGMVLCREFISKKGVFDQYVSRLKQLRKHLREELKHLKLFESDDISKLVISTERTNLSGKNLYDILLKDYQIQCEMSAGDYVVAMTSVGDNLDCYDRLQEVLTRIDKECICFSDKNTQENVDYVEIVCTISEAKEKNVDKILLKDSIGCVSGNFIYIYPPGVPLIVPGERVTKGILHTIEDYIQKGFNVIGIEDEKITIIKEE